MTTALAEPVEVEPAEKLDTSKIVAETSSALDIATRFKIDTNDAYECAAELLRGWKTIDKEIDATFDPVISAAHASHKAACLAKKRHAAPLEQAESRIKSKMIAWNREQEIIRLEAQRKADEEARRLAEEARRAEAAAMEAAGEKKEAAALMETPIVVAPVVVPKATPKVTGIASKKVWKFRITDEFKVPREYLMLDEKKIGGVVRSMRGDTAIPGIEAYEEDQISAAGF